MHLQVAKATTEYVNAVLAACSKVHLVLIGAQLHLETSRPSVDTELVSICRCIRQLLHCFPWHLYSSVHRPYILPFWLSHPALTSKAGASQQIHDRRTKTKPLTHKPVVRCSALVASAVLLQRCSHASVRKLKMLP